MISLKFCSIILVVTDLTTSVKVDMQGSLSLGKDVINTISQYLQESYLKSGVTFNNRRSGSDPDPLTAFARLLAIMHGDAKTIRGIVVTEDLCKDLQFCQEPRKMNYIADYVSTISNAADRILASVLDPGGQRVPGSIFMKKLRNVLNEAHKILNHADKYVGLVGDDKEAHEWVSVIKGISAKVLEEALDIAHEELSGEMQHVRKKLIQKVVISVIIVENEYENKLCTDLDMCVLDHEVTKSLHKIFEQLNYTTEQRAKEFVKCFYESVPEDIYSITDEATADEFQVILSEMSFSTSVPTRDILLSVLKAVQARKACLEIHNNSTMQGFDSQLVNIILSDMDHFYFKMNRKKSPFEDFMAIFSGWLKTGGRLGVHIRQVIQKIQKTLVSAPKELVSKLTHEVRVFLELNVGPENE